MSRNQRRGTSRNRNSPAKPKITAVPQASLPPVTNSQKQGSRSQFDLAEFTVLFLMPLLLTIILIIPILNGFHLIRPFAEIIAEPFVPFIGIVAAIIGAGIIKVNGIDLFHLKKPRGAYFASVIGILLSISIVIFALPFYPTQSSARQSSNQTAIPYPPYKGVLVMDGMQSKPSKGYYWQQLTDSQGSCEFIGSDYHIATDNQKGLEICSAVNTNFHNFAFEIDMTFQHLGVASILFEATGQAAYQLNITSLGNYAQLSLGVLSGLGSGKLSYRELIAPTLVVVKDQGPVIFALAACRREQKNLDSKRNLLGSADPATKEKRLKRERTPGEQEKR